MVRNSAALAQHPKIAKIVFTGGTKVGRAIGTAAAQSFALTTLELAGKDDSGPPKRLN
jgi:phenylacetaldehyde dehydrogenase